METWKETYDSYLTSWHEESAITREKALATRKRIEEELAAEQKTSTDRSKAAEKEGKAKELEAKRAEKLRLELGGGPSSPLTAPKDQDQGREEREGNVKEAWELVRGDAARKEGVVATDGRGVMEEDLAAAQTISPQEHRSRIKQVSVLYGIHGRIKADAQSYRPLTIRSHPPSPCRHP